jgi:uncharacterized protein (DUF1697 family)
MASTSHIALLRGINVSGKNLIKMAELKEGLTEAGLSDVSTYIQSGNILFKSALDPESSTRLIESTLLKDFDIQVPVMVFARTYLEEIVKHQPFEFEIEPNKLAISFLSNVVDAVLLTELDHLILQDESVEMGDQVLYLYYPNGQGRSKLSGNAIERKLGVTSTARNWNTVNKLLALSDY